MKKHALLVLIIALCLLLVSCGCKHEWNAANCLLPKTCSLCGETEGEATGHIWKSADCTNPETCTRCGDTHGEALGHLWRAPTCEEDEICTRCEAVGTSALGHTYGEWECDGEIFAHTCGNCGNTETLSPEAFFVHLLEGTWRARFYEDGSREGHENPEHFITILSDGTVELILNSRLFYPETARLVTEEFSYKEFSTLKCWRIVFFLENEQWWEEEMGPDVPKEFGLFLHVDYSADTGELVSGPILNYYGYHDMWIFEEKTLAKAGEA